MAWMVSRTTPHSWARNAARTFHCAPSSESGVLPAWAYQPTASLRCFLAPCRAIWLQAHWRSLSCRRVLSLSSSSAAMRGSLAARRAMAKAASARPNVVGRLGLAGDQRIEHRPAGFRRLQHGQPELLGLGQHAAVGTGLQAVAGNVRLGGEQAGIFCIDLAPQGALAQPAYPVGAQLFGNIAALVAAQEIVDDSRVTLVHPHAQPVVFGIRCQFVIAKLADGLLQF